MKSIEELGLIRQNIGEEQFYKYKDGSIFPYYKEDIKREINVFKPNTFLPLFKELDIPFIPHIWLETIKRVMKKGNDLSTVFGQYLAKMYHLKGFKEFGFEDSKQFCVSDIDTYCKQTYVPEIEFSVEWEDSDNVW